MDVERRVEADVLIVVGDQAWVKVPGHAEEVKAPAAQVIADLAAAGTKLSLEELPGTQVTVVLEPLEDREGVRLSGFRPVEPLL